LVTDVVEGEEDSELFRDGARAHMLVNWRRGVDGGSLQAALNDALKRRRGVASRYCKEVYEGAAVAKCARGACAFPRTSTLTSKRSQAQPIQRFVNHQCGSTRRAACARTLALEEERSVDEGSVKSTELRRVFLEQSGRRIQGWNEVANALKQLDNPVWCQRGREVMACTG